MVLGTFQLKQTTTVNGKISVVEIGHNLKHLVHADLYSRFSNGLEG